MEMDWSEWTFFDPSEVMDLSIKEISETAASVVLKEIADDTSVDVSPGFDFDDEKHATKELYLSVAFFYETVAVVNLAEAAMHATHEDPLRARFIADILRRIADDLDKKFP